jgi:predicted nucleic acid-binding Zn ribbon protein
VEPSEKHCVICGLLLVGKRADAETCSTRCRVRRAYWRKMGKPIPPRRNYPPVDDEPPF